MQSDLLSTCPDFSAKVSSVLNKNVREYGKKFLFDNCDDTCWNSDQGSPQFISLNFQRQPLEQISQVQIQFQGGFVGTHCHFLINEETKRDFFPEDSSKLQTFNLVPQQENNDPKFHCPITSLKIVFGGSTDFFGRITIYHLKLF